jgi:flagellar biosynthesis protein FlhB
MDWVPVAFIIFKIVVIGAGMFFAIKWHYDKDRKAHQGDVLSAVGKMAAILVLSLLGLLFITFMFARMLGLDMTFPR